MSSQLESDVCQQCRSIRFVPSGKNYGGNRSPFEPYKERRNSLHEPVALCRCRPHYWRSAECRLIAEDFRSYRL